MKGSTDRWSWQLTWTLKRMCGTSCESMFAGEMSICIKENHSGHCHLNKKSGSRNTFMQLLSSEVFGMLPLGRIGTYLGGSKMCRELIFEVSLRTSNMSLYAHRYHWSVGARSASAYFNSASILAVTEWAPGKAIRAKAAQRTETCCSLWGCTQMPEVSLPSRTGGKSSPPPAITVLGVCIHLAVPLIGFAWGEAWFSLWNSKEIVPGAKFIPGDVNSPNLEALPYCWPQVPPQPRLLWCKLVAKLYDAIIRTPSPRPKPSQSCVFKREKIWK